ncbi:sex-determining region Y protein-like [Zootermopsis nevadensis]|uniref:sex-determining region Y protein-like n=1 Tax=Zootermopsis nevadensis TaxID=136037 RepID=UPI000B8EAAE0|nr:sex-determining region Y protein-like [Zootermopsis nevadensis]
MVAGCSHVNRKSTNVNPTEIEDMTITCMPINRIRKLAADRNTDHTMGNTHKQQDENMHQAHHQLQITGKPKNLQKKRKAKQCKKTPKCTKIPRPPNAFVIFSSEWRKNLAALYPADSNNQISVRLGYMWRAIDVEHKEEYFARARQADAEHKKKYPDYVYNPNEVRKQKSLREQARGKKLRRPRRQSGKRHLAMAQNSSALRLPAQEHQWGGFPATEGRSHPKKCRMSFKPIPDPTINPSKITDLDIQAILKDLTSSPEGCSPSNCLGLSFLSTENYLKETEIEPTIRLL